MPEPGPPNALLVAEGLKSPPRCESRFYVCVPWSIGGSRGGRLMKARLLLA